MNNKIETKQKNYKTKTENFEKKISKPKINFHVTFL